MKYTYSKLKLSAGIFDRYDIDGQSEVIDGLSSINIFIGENNAGKSRFMRELAKMHASEYSVQEINLQNLKNAFDIFYVQIKQQWQNLKRAVSSGTVEGVGQFSVKDTELETYIPSMVSDSYFDSSKPNPSLLLKTLTSIRDHGITNVSHFMSRSQYQADIENFRNELRSDYADHFFEILAEYVIERIEFKKYYIPTLRSLSAFGNYQIDQEQDIFGERIKSVYKFNDDSKIDIFTGQKIYTRIRSMLLGSREERDRMAEYEQFLSSKLFDGKEIVIIPREEDDVVYVGIDGVERPIFDLGDGIQSLIILTFPLFECEHGLFFIEEPEVNMHPGMQRKFLEAIQSRPQHQYYITTHSNHLLDLTIDYSNISIYSFKLSKEKHMVNIVTQGDRNVLDIIGVRNTSVFLANKSIWVEGITDRLYIRRYLDLYLDQNPNIERPREDIDYIFVEYGGNNITHWSFLDNSTKDSTINVDRLTGNLMLISDKDGEAKQERKKELKSKLKDRYVLLSEREIENTLSLEVLVKVVCMYEKVDYSKIDMKIFEIEGLKDLPIGEYIETKIIPMLGKKMVRKGGYKTDSGTIKDKLTFAHRAIENLEYDRMSESSRKLAKRIYEFVTSK